MRMGMARWIRLWPMYRQLTGPDPPGRGKAAECRRSETLAPRTESADRVVSSGCPYCAFGCAARLSGIGEHPPERWVGGGLVGAGLPPRRQAVSVCSRRTVSIRGSSPVVAAIWLIPASRVSLTARRVDGRRRGLATFRAGLSSPF